MKKSKLYHFGIMSLLVVFILSCEKNEDLASLGQTLIVEYSDEITNSPLNGATVELYQSDAESKYLDAPPLLTGTTDENGEVFFSKEQFENLGRFFPIEFTVFIKKDFYSNIHTNVQQPAIFTLNTGSDADQKNRYVVKLSVAEVFAAPSKWNYIRTEKDGVDITSSISECAKDNYITAIIGTTFTMLTNEGANDCGTIEYAALFTPIGNLNHLQGFENGYTLPASGEHAFQASNPAMGANIILEVKSDSLYYSAALNGNNFMSVYGPEF